MPADKSQRELELEAALEQKDNEKRLALEEKEAEHQAALALKEQEVEAKDAEIATWQSRLVDNDRVRKDELKEAGENWAAEYAKERALRHEAEQKLESSLPVENVHAREAELLGQIEDLKAELQAATANVNQKDNDHANVINGLQADIEGQHRDKAKLAEEKEAVSRRNGELEAEATYARGYAELLAAIGARTLVEALEWIQQHKQEAVINQ